MMEDVGLMAELRALVESSNAAMPGIIYSTACAAWEMLKAAEAAAAGSPDLDHLHAEAKAARERCEILRDMARRQVFAQGGAVVPSPPN